MVYFTKSMTCVTFTAMFTANSTRFPCYCPTANIAEDENRKII